MNIWKEVWEYIKMFLIVILIVFVIDEVVFINARIPSGSMENTIMTKDRIFGFRMAYGINLDFFNKDVWTVKMRDPKRMDIVIFRYPDDESELFIKRIIGLPGETLEIHNGKVFIDGVLHEECNAYIKEEWRYGTEFGPVEIPENSFFMMGDNRNNSRDSRFWTNTFVTFDQIVGKAMVRYWPRPKILW